jgi:hypothetical protein
MMTTFAFSGNFAIARHSEVLLRPDYRAARWRKFSLFATSAKRRATRNKKSVPYGGPDARKTGGYEYRRLTSLVEFGKKIRLLDNRFAFDDFHVFRTGERCAVAVGQRQEAAAIAKRHRFAGSDGELVLDAAFGHDDRVAFAVRVGQGRGAGSASGDKDGEECNRNSVHSSKTMPQGHRPLS